jgi:hypothetical protein
MDLASLAGNPFERSFQPGMAATAQAPMVRRIVDRAAVRDRDLVIDDVRERQPALPLALRAERVPTAMRG